MPITLYIYSGLGNVIAIVDSVRKYISMSKGEVKNLKQIGKIDFDQLIVILPPSESYNDFDVKIFNNDGSKRIGLVETPSFQSFGFKLL